MVGEERLRSLRDLTGRAHTALQGVAADERKPYQDEFDRLNAALGYLGIALERTHPELVTDAAEAELTRLLEQIEADAATAVASAASYADALIVQVAHLPPMRDRELEQEAKRAASSFRRSSAQHINAVSADARKLRRRMQEITEAVENAASDANATNEAATAELRAELESIQAAATAAQKQIEGLAESHEASFEKEQTDRAEQAEARWTETREAIQGQADDLVSDLARMRDDAQGLVGAVSAASTANHFRDDAKSERHAYWLLLAVTVLALGAAVFFAGRAASTPEPEIQRLIAKLGVSGALLGLAVFTGARARDHRERDKHSRDKELDMRAFGPFIEPLPPKEQIRERILMARRFFGRADPDTPDQTDEEIGLLSSTDDIDVAVRDLRQRNRA